METLNPIEARVLACLVEKSMTTPEYYPLTLNALTAACNQKSNRDPLMQLGEADIAGALDSLRDKKLAWTVALVGSRTPKYRHSLLEVYPLTPQQTAVLCELMLRGPQTIGELRTRAERMAHFENTTEVQVVLDQLAAWEGTPLASRFPRQAGQREERYMHGLCGPIPTEGPSSAILPETTPPIPSAETERISALEAGLVSLTAEVEKLKAQVTGLIQQRS